MNNLFYPRRSALLIALLAAGVVAVLTLPLVMAQNPELQQKLAEIKQAAAQNQQALATYTWQEQQTVSVKSEQKSQSLYQIQIGPDGKQQKVNLTPQQPEQQGGRQYGLKHRAIEEKKGEMKEYAQQVVALVHSYAPHNPQKMQQAFQQGNAALAPGGGDVSLKFTNYNRPGDSLTLVFSPAQKAIQSVQVSSYLSDPSDAVTFSAQFGKLPDGTSYMAMATVNGIQKQLTIQITEFNYRKIGS